MKKLLIALAASTMAVSATPALAQDISVGGSFRVGDFGYVQIQARPDYRDRYHDHDRYRGRDYQYDYRRGGYNRCYGGQDQLTVRNLPSWGGSLIIDGRRYRADNQLCVRRVNYGDFVFHDRNNNGRFDRNEAGGRVQRYGYNYRRAGFSDQYTVTLRR